MSEQAIPRGPDERPQHLSTVHESALRMQEQFALTGTYDAQDITKVLGDPRCSVSYVVSESYFLDTRRNPDYFTTSAFSGEVKSWPDSIAKS